ncbi:unnamed protein product [Timema podura]|uniref:Uncharacterized protein n=1 Tax=Timema podura TaxID=61482 RepID=A0ABN7NBS2_TIMPD|nr:unnamed protein product [Timema podura]
MLLLSSSCAINERLKPHDSKPVKQGNVEPPPRRWGEHSWKQKGGPFECDREETWREGLASYRGEPSREVGSVSYHGELGRKEGSVNYRGEPGRKEGSANYRGEPCRKKGLASYHGEPSRKVRRVIAVNRAGRKVRRITVVNLAGRKVWRVTAVNRAGRKVRRVTAVKREGREVRRVTTVNRAGRKFMLGRRGEERKKNTREHLTAVYFTKWVVAQHGAVQRLTDASWLSICSFYPPLVGWFGRTRLTAERPRKKGEGFLASDLSH